MIYNRSFRRIKKCKQNKPCFEKSKRDLVYLDNTSVKSIFTFGNRCKRDREFKFVLKRKQVMSCREESLNGVENCQSIDALSFLSFGESDNKLFYNSKEMEKKKLNLNGSSCPKKLSINIQLVISLKNKQLNSNRTLDSLIDSIRTKSTPTSPKKVKSMFKSHKRSQFNFFKLFKA